MTGHEDPEGEKRYSSTLSLTSALDGVARPLYPRERPGTHCIGGWVGSTAGLDGCAKSRPPPGFNPRTVQAVASSYTIYAIPVHPYNKYTSFTGLSVPHEYLVWYYHAIVTRCA
jgi:hypothetical protein